MKDNTRHAVLLLTICLCFVFLGDAYGEEYEALKGLNDIKAVFDVRIAEPKSAASHLKLVHQSFRDGSIRSVSKNPSFAVVFMGPSVKLISKNREGYPPEDQKALDEIASIISEMSKDGIYVEVCLFAAQAFGVDPSSILPGIKRVENGWISSIGYQGKGYSLVPAY